MKEVEHAKPDSLKRVKKPVFINIQNSKEEYVERWIDQKELTFPEVKKTCNENGSGEWAAILNTFFT